MSSLGVALRPPAPAEAGSAARTGRKPNWLGWGLAAIILAGCVLFVDLDEVLRSLRRVGPVELALLLLVATADRLLMGYKWALLLRVGGVRLPTWRIVRYFYQASFAGAFLPSHVGGDVLRAWWVARESGVTHPVFASLVVERALGLVSAVNWAVLGGTVFACHLDPGRTPAWIGLGLVAAVSVNAVMAVPLSAPVRRLLAGLLAGHPGRGRIVTAARDFCAALAAFGAEPRRLGLNLLLTIAEQGLQMLLYFGIALAIGAVASPVAFLAATALFTLVVRLPIAPDGWGVGELTAIGVYGLIGVSAAEAFSVSVIGHLVPVLALSPAFLFLLNADSARPPAGAGRVETP